MDMITKLGAAAKEVADFQMRETLRQAFKLISNVVVATRTPPWEKPVDVSSVLAEHHADLQVAAELLADLAKEVIQLRKAKINLDALQDAQKAYFKTEND